jgi:hypothetical protein
VRLGRGGFGGSGVWRYNGGVASKNCFINKDRPCDLTCKAAFPVDDAVDPVDCYLIWLAAHLGDGAIDFRRMLEAQGLGDGPDFPAGGAPGAGPGGPKPSKPPGTDFSPN